ncbi:hypothetical protein [Hyphomonas sp.]|uniref:hypothetical protein n=1 Tax=Hyphomonas sp. TaxID=87 RepID=UPI001D6C10A4|nr:hypothetical protein [Hyphomonas sp.]MBU4063698.1 hypothetical protein [Alphaproteobacteria bacterium]MBU4164341.1 hypothetical protein [Alphaproteobacteria bacterium]
MPGKKPKPKGEKSQRDRFLETAKQVEAGEEKTAFERAFKAVVPKAKKRSG